MHLPPVRPEDQLRDALNQLVSSELVFRGGTPTEATYTSARPGPGRTTARSSSPARSSSTPAWQRCRKTSSRKRPTPNPNCLHIIVRRQPY